MHTSPQLHRVSNHSQNSRPFFALAVRQTVAAGLGMILVLLAGCGAGKPPAHEAPPPPVLVGTVVQRDVPVYREWVAQLNGSVNAQISPKVSGYIIARDYQEGYFVTKGQVLFEIDPRPFQAALDQAKANVAQAVANLGNSKLNVDRDTPLAKEKAIAQAQLDNDIQTMAANQAAVDAAIAQQKTAELNLEWTKVRAPIDGIAGLATAQVGNLVNTSSTLTSISQVDPIRAYFSLSESEYLTIASRLNLIIRGQAANRTLGASDVQFIQANGLPFAAKGRFVLVNREVNTGTGTIQFAGEFDNKNAILRPGGFGRVRIKIGTQADALLVPQRAVNEIQGQYQVAVLTADNRAEFRSVELGERTGDAWIVTKGLHAGDRIVVEGSQKLRNGMPVQAKPYLPTTAKVN
jgi:membrane fusion protein, multidrug efflux system